MYVIDRLYHYSETIFSQQYEYIPRYTITYCLLIPHLLDTFFQFTVQNIWVFLICINFLSGFDS
jgi:hypothetical protein